MNVLKVILFGIMPILLFSCADKAAVEQAKSELAELDKELEGLRAEAKEKHAKQYKLKLLAAAMESTEAAVFEIEQSHYPLEDYVNYLEKGIEEHDREIEVWREAHRKALVGVKAPSLATSEGRRIRDIEILKVEDQVLTIESNGQQMTLEIKELAEPVRKKLGYEDDYR